MKVTACSLQGVKNSMLFNWEYTTLFFYFVLLWFYFIRSVIYNIRNKTRNNIRKIVRQLLCKHNITSFESLIFKGYEKAQFIQLIKQA